MKRKTEIDLDEVQSVRYCMNENCDSWERQGKCRGRIIGKSLIGQYAEIRCDKCGETTRVYLFKCRESGKWFEIMELMEDKRDYSLRHP